MAGRMSNRDRIQHLRAEADATAKEKAAAQAEKAARPPAPRKSATKSAGKAAKPTRGRVRIVWVICDSSGKEVKQFPYSQEQEARAEAQQQCTATGRVFFVKQADTLVE